MNAKTFLAIATLGSLSLDALHAQDAGTAGPGAAAAGGSIRPSTTTAANAATADTGITVTPPAAASPAGADVGALRPPGTPDMSSSMPSRSGLDRSSGTGPDAPAGGASLPRGISTTPPRAGVSPMSGIPVGDIPGFSRATEPIGPQPETGRTINAVGRPINSIPQPVAGAAQPDANAQIGLGHTTVVPTPPPAAHVEVPSPTTTDAANQVWVPGHYSWLGGEWVWMEGSWQRPPTPSAVWAAGTYDSQNQRWTEGHWETMTAARERNGRAPEPRR